MVRTAPSSGHNKAHILKKIKIFQLSKGFYGRIKNCYTLAVRKVKKYLLGDYVRRKLIKREYRQEWIQTIDIATREHGLNYPIFINRLKQDNIGIDRKMLADLAMTEPKTFKGLCDIAYHQLNEGLMSITNLMPQEENKNLKK